MSLTYLNLELYPTLDLVVVVVVIVLVVVVAVLVVAMMVAEVAGSNVFCIIISCSNDSSGGNTKNCSREASVRFILGHPLLTFHVLYYLFIKFCEIFLTCFPVSAVLQTLPLRLFRFPVHSSVFPSFTECFLLSHSFYFILTSRS